MQKILIVCRSFAILLLICFQHVSIAYGESGCEQANWGLPLEGMPTVNSPFNSTSHYGTDYKAADGDNVLSVADGVILKNGFNLKTLNKPDPRSALMIKGWGRYVVLRHSDGSTTLYAHLIEDSTAHLKEGDPVTKGTIIGKADFTGGVTGPHLHLEYTSDGMWWRKSSRKDPHPCILGCKPEDSLTISGTETITRNSSAQYTASGCPWDVSWSVSGTGATISSTGLLTVGSTACGTLTVIANCSQCGTSTTKNVRVTDAGGWAGGRQYDYCGTDYSVYACPGYYHPFSFRWNEEIINGELWYQEWFILPETSSCSCIAFDYLCSPILPYTPHCSVHESWECAPLPQGWHNCEIIYNEGKIPWGCP